MKYRKYKRIGNIAMMGVIILYLIAFFNFPGSREYERIVTWIALLVVSVNLFISIKYKDK